MSNDDTTQNTDYEVGFGKPPSDTQFKPGESGNPKGRPKGAKNKKPENQLETIFRKELLRRVHVEDRDGMTEITMLEATVRSTVVKAAKGEFRSQKLIIETYKAMETTKATNEDDKLIININFSDEIDKS